MKFAACWLTLLMQAAKASFIGSPTPWLCANSPLVISFMPSSGLTCTNETATPSRQERRKTAATNLPLAALPGKIQVIASVG